MSCEPLSGSGATTAREIRTKADWAQEVAGMEKGRYADCEKVTLAAGDLNTDTTRASCSGFESERARELVRRVEFCFTPNHVSFRNIAE